MEPPSSVLVETRVTAKMLERASYEAELKQGHEAHRKSGKADDDPADSDSDGLEVYEDEVGGKMELKINDLQRTETPPELIVMPSTLASNDNNTVPSKNPNAQGKRKRPVVDPFSGKFRLFVAAWQTNPCSFSVPLIYSCSQATTLQLPPRLHQYRQYHSPLRPHQLPALFLPPPLYLYAHLARPKTKMTRNSKDPTANNLPMRPRRRK